MCFIAFKFNFVLLCNRENVFSFGKLNSVALMSIENNYSFAFAVCFCDLCLTANKNFQRFINWLPNFLLLLSDLAARNARC